MRTELFAAGVVLQIRVAARVEVDTYPRRLLAMLGAKDAVQSPGDVLAGRPKSGGEARVRELVHGGAASTDADGDVHGEHGGSTEKRDLAWEAKGRPRRAVGRRDARTSRDARTEGRVNATASARAGVPGGRARR